MWWRLTLYCGSFCGWVLLLGVAGIADAQILVANDDDYAVPFGEALVVEFFGVLDNDTLDGENAGESGASAELVADASHGTLALSPDGSFTYAPGASFDGADSFVYRATSGAASAEAVVTLTACTGGPQLFVCWREAAFLAKAKALGYPGFAEGFEDDAVWGIARTPYTVPSVSSQGIEWRANDFDPTHVAPPLPPDPPPNEITTGPGPARTGLAGVFDLEHGYAVGTPSQCDVDEPAAECLYHDGFTIRRKPGLGPLHGAGGFFTGTFGAKVAFVLDGDWQNPVVAGQLFGGGHQFFGLIDAGPASLTELQFRELSGKIGQALFLFGDDFTILAQPLILLPTLDGPALIGLGLLLAATATWYLRRSHASS